MHASATEGENTSSGHERSRSDSSWIVLLAGVAFVIAVAATFSFVMTRDDNGGETKPAFSLALLDSFDRPASDDGLGSNASGTWTTVAGVWGLEAGVAILRTPVTEGDNLTTYQLADRNMSVNLRIAGRSQCGVVVRYVDPLNYVGLVRVNAFAVWNLIQVVNGEETVLSKVPDDDAQNVNVTLTATDGVLSASVGLNTVTLIQSPTPDGTRVGLVARGEGAEQCGWDDVTAQRAN